MQAIPTEDLLLEAGLDPERLARVRETGNDGLTGKWLYVIDEATYVILGGDPEVLYQVYWQEFHLGWQADENSGILTMVGVSTDNNGVHDDTRAGIRALLSDVYNLEQATLS